MKKNKKKKGDPKPRRASFSHYIYIFIYLFINCFFSFNVSKTGNTSDQKETTACLGDAVIFFAVNTSSSSAY